MLMIVALHIVKSHIEILGYSDWISWIVRSFCICAVDVFVLISGYFGIHFRLNRLVSLDLQTLFYSIASLLFLIIIGYHEIGVLDFHALIPIITKRYWFVTCYAVLYLLSPFINIVFALLSKEQLKTILIICFVLFYLWPTFNSLVLANQLISDNGYGIVNFIYLYLLGRYIHEYGLFPSYSKFSFLITYIVSCSILALLQPIVSLVLGYEFKSLFAYNSLFVFISALGLFLFFERLSFSSTIINRLANNCLAVYLIHQGPGMWEWATSFFHLGNFNGLKYITVLIVFPVILYLLSVVIDSVRIKLFSPFEEIVSNRFNILFVRFKAIFVS